MTNYRLVDNKRKLLIINEQLNWSIDLIDGNAEIDVIEAFWQLITKIPVDLNKFTNLKKLSFNHCRLGSLPESISNLTRLEELWLDGNQLYQFPPQIVDLTNLVKLDLTSNEISAIPESISQLTQLKLLWLADNCLTSLPYDIGKLTNLTSLGISNNQIIMLPSSFAALIPNLSLDHSRFWLGQNNNLHIPLSFTSSRLFTEVIGDEFYYMMILSNRINNVNHLPMNGYFSTIPKDIVNLIVDLLLNEPVKLSYVDSDERIIRGIIGKDHRQKQPFTVGSYKWIHTIGRKTHPHWADYQVKIKYRKKM